MKKSFTVFRVSIFLSIILNLLIKTNISSAQGFEDSINFLNESIAELTVEVPQNSKNMTLKIVCENGKILVKNIINGGKALFNIGENTSPNSEGEIAQYSIKLSKDQRSSVINIYNLGAIEGISFKILLMKTSKSKVKINLIKDEIVIRKFFVDFTTKTLEEAGP